MDEALFSKKDEMRSGEIAVCSSFLLPGVSKVGGDVVQIAQECGNGHSPVSGALRMLGLELSAAGLVSTRVQRKLLKTNNGLNNKAKRSRNLKRVVR